MTISRKTPIGHEGISAAASEAGRTEVARTALRPLASDIAQIRLRGTEPPAPATLGQEELLRLSTELPIEEGAEAVARAVCEVVRDVLAPAAVGVVLRSRNGEAAWSRPRVILARSHEARDLEVHHVVDASGPPRQMFPTLIDEWIVPLPAPFEGSSLHVGDASPESDPRDPRDRARARASFEVAERAALVLASGLRAAEAIAVARENSAHLRALQARIVQYEKLASVGQIAAKVVHELNNPLTAIVTYAGFLVTKLERAGHDAADVERLRRIGESADRILGFSRELTTYARPNDETPSPVDLAEVVERAVVFCEHLFAEHGIRVRTRREEGAPPIVARRGQLTQVFVNLVTNACHAVQEAARGEAGVIEIATGPTGDGGVRVSVGDNGNGISPENVVRIFDPFFTTKPEGQGTGLGLSIVRSIVEAHGGRVWVRSVVGSGTSFIIEFRRGRDG